VAWRFFLRRAARAVSMIGVIAAGAAAIFVRRVDE
jgi:hypothetical protein